MAKSLAKVANARKELFRKLKPLVRSVRTELRQVERFLERVIKRKRTWPDEDDLIELLKELADIAAALQKVTVEVRGGYAE